jgi:hypothetical protein
VVSVKFLKCQVRPGFQRLVSRGQWPLGPSEVKLGSSKIAKYYEKRFEKVMPEMKLLGELG